jgi:dihydrofolate synthase/folylpolyglutamate synthase
VNYREAIDWLYGTQLFGIKLGLENVGKLFDELGLLQRLEGRNVIHVAGTNGKGSVCAMSDSILRAAGKRSGLFTSPHLVTYRERIRVNGEMIPEGAVARGLSDIRERVKSWEPHPTFFEITTALAVEHFCESDCEFLVMETGMGGRLDATNIMPADVAVITPVGMDHSQWLGDSLAEIAAEKAGIIKAGVPVVSAAQLPDVESVIRQTAEALKAPLRFVTEPISRDWSLGLAGRHQRENAALTLAAIESLDLKLGEEAIRDGLESVSWPGRFQTIGDRFVIDGAHNEPAIEVLVNAWRETYGDQKPTVIFGGVSSKNTAAILSKLTEIAAAFVFVAVRSQRGLPVGELETIWHGLKNSSIPFRTVEQLSDALREAGDQETGTVLVTGSLFLAGEALAELQADAPFEISEQ